MWQICLTPRTDEVFWGWTETRFGNVTTLWGTIQYIFKLKRPQCNTTQRDFDGFLWPHPASHFVCHTGSSTAVSSVSWTSEEFSETFEECQEWGLHKGSFFLKGKQTRMFKTCSLAIREINIFCFNSCERCFLESHWLLTRLLVAKCLPLWVDFRSII